MVPKKKGMAALSAALLLMLPDAGFAWNGSDHQEMTRLALQQAPADWRLDREVPVRPLQAFLDRAGKIRPGLLDRRHFAFYLGINPEIRLDPSALSVAGRTSLAPIEILSLYATDPDDGRDQDLFLVDEMGGLHYAYPDQKWFGAIRGENSQAFRHIEKPPFAWRHPLSTFGLPFGKLGQATDRAEIYFQLSQLAFALDEEYWGWRFLAGTMHYIEDLHQPYHAGQITPWLLLKGLWAYLSWGRTTDGFMGTFSHLIANSHRFYESYVASPSAADRPLKQAALSRLRGDDLSPSGGTVRERAIEIRDSSNRLFPRIVSAVSRVTDSKLSGPHRFRSDAPDADDPEQFLDRANPHFEKTMREVFDLTGERFESAGRMIRTVVDLAIRSREKRKTEDCLFDLDRLLQPTSS